jgi:Tfp pilus assembly protein PilF
MNRWRVRAAVAILAAVLAGAGPARAQTAQDGEGHFQIGLTHLREGRTALALEELKKAIKIDGKNPYFYKALGVCYMQLGKNGDAVDALRTSLKLNPYYADARADLGTALIGAGKRDEGKAELLTAFNDPTNPTPDQTARNLGQAYLEEKNFSEAASWFRSSLTRNNKVLDAHLGLAEALQGMSRGDDALHALEDSVKAMPAEPQLLLALGQTYYGAGRFNEARTMLEEARSKDPNGPIGKRATELLTQFAK